MKGNIGVTFVLKMKKELMDISRDKGMLETIDLTGFVERRMWEVKNVAQLENVRLNKDISTGNYFSQFFTYCDLMIDEDDKKEFCNYILGNNCSLHIIKTEIPAATLKANKVLLEANVFFKEGVSIDKEHIYSIDELVSLCSENKIVIMSFGDNHQDINDSEYRNLYAKYLDNALSLATLDINKIDRFNYLLLFNSYPQVFDYLREKIDFETLKSILKNYNENVREILTEESNKCSDVINSYTKKIDRINELKKQF